MDREQKLRGLKEKLKTYEEKLANEMIGYRGVIHESAVSEIKHSKVMVLKAMVEQLRNEIQILEQQDPKNNTGL